VAVPEAAQEVFRVEVATLAERARAFAERAHASIDQRRKYTNEPYIVHPAAVVKLVRSVPHTEEMLAAAWLHDVVEDTPVTLPRIREEFGFGVMLLVHELTDRSKPEDGNRARRKEIDRLRLAAASPAAQTIKLADLIDNTKDIVANDPEFARVYLVEKRKLLSVLTRGDHELWLRAFRQLHLATLKLIETKCHL
jgi:(p)ppGpp synthase/HD superfamily hydrolase